MYFLQEALNPQSVFQFGNNRLPIRHTLCLARGSGFRPTPRPRSPEDLDNFVKEQYSLYSRRLRLANQFGLIRPDIKLYEPNPLFSPEPGPECLEDYILRTEELVYSSLETTKALHSHFKDMMRRSKPRKDILSLMEYLKWEDLCVAKADKNLGLCVISRKDYTKLLSEYLQSASFTVISTEEAANIWKTGRASILTSCKEFWPADKFGWRGNLFRFIEKGLDHKANAWISPYLLLKVHKLSAKELEDKVIPKPRLIAPCQGYFSERISRYVDSVIYPLYLLKNRYNLKDSRSLLIDLSTLHFPSSITLMTMDVNALYPNIPLREGLEAMDLFLLECRMNPVERDFMLNVLRTVLYSNVYEFNNVLYLQVTGTAMGTPTAVVFANVFLYMLGRKLIAKYINERKLLFYRRLIDDLFMIWDTHTNAMDFKREYDSLHTNINTTHNISQYGLEMLDVFFYKGPRFSERGILDTKLFQKAHNRYAYLPGNSFHPSSLKRGFISSEIQRIVRASSSFDEYYESRALFLKRLIARKYKASLLRKAFEKVSYSDRQNLLFSESKTSIARRSVAKLVFISQYTPQLLHMNISHLLHIFWDACAIGLGGNWTSTQPTTAHKATSSLYAILRKQLPK